MLQTSTLQFLRGLKKNNDKSWFDKNRTAYESAKKDYETFIQGVIDELGKKDAHIAGLRAKDCMFRINRDIRFSKNKSPYKTNFGASVKRGGRKSRYAGYYLHVEPGESFVGGGIWMPMPAELAGVRQEIDYNLDEFQKILRSASFKKYYNGLYTDQEISLSRVPKGYETTNPAAEFLKLKSFFSMTPSDDKALVSKDLVKTTVHKLLAIKPLVDFLNQAVGE
ncbi:MAG: DUF2461 domain-containing protein [Chitinophagaceae bacterium]|jgi:uncharacterized protein (TIGR02453 family)|nr:DUF2461 domain-containing protein [Chitinophagaceae bacterium]